MADRTSAAKCGQVIRLLHQINAGDIIIKEVWNLLSDADFRPYQAEVDDLRRIYGLDWTEDDEANYLEED